MSVKSEVLKQLEQNRGESVSGGALSMSLGVSRNAVWKAISKLRGEGYEIEAATNRGYRLLDGGDIISSEGIAPYLKTEFFGREIKVFNEVDSTNNKARLLAGEGASHGLLVISDRQTAGKGRLGRSFYSPAGAGIYMSLIIRPELPAEQAVLITSCAAVAVAEAVEALSGAEAKIKWVNDVFAGGKKICGILTEAGMNAETCRLDYAVVGIGINVTNGAFPPEVAGVATSVLEQAGKKISRNRLIAEVMNRLEEQYLKLREKAFLPEYIRRSCVVGRDVTVYEGNNTYPARAVTIDESARLIVKLPDGTQKALNSGEVSVRPL